MSPACPPSNIPAAEIYLDGNATTRVLPAALAAARAAMADDFGNPSSTHASGLRARRLVDAVRARAAAVLTGGGQESGRRSGTENMAGIAALGAVFDALEDGGTFSGTAALIARLDPAGIRVSGGSACSAAHVGPSHVLLAMGWPPERAASAVRLSLDATASADFVREACVRLRAALGVRRLAVA